MRRFFNIKTDGSTAAPSVTISTGNPDRYRDRVLPAGGDFTNFLKNPVILYGHDYQQLPVGRATSITSDTGGVRASWKWLENDSFADRVKNAWGQGVLNAASIGFIPRKKAYDSERAGFDFLEWELLEFSIVAVPANAEAVRTLKALDLDFLDTNEIDLASIAAGEEDAELDDDIIQAAIREALPSIARAAADQAIARQTGRIYDAIDLFDTFAHRVRRLRDTDLTSVSPATVRAAIREAVRDTLDEHLHAAELRLTGRVD